MTQTDKFRDQPLTVAFIRDELRNQRYSGNLFEALEFMLSEYDTVSDKLRTYTKPATYTVHNVGYRAPSKSMDVV